MTPEIIHEDSVVTAFKVNDHLYGVHPKNLEVGTYQGIVKFQKGDPAIEENGLTLEALLAICISRLDSCNQGNFKCLHNDLAIEHMKAAKVALEERQSDRKNRFVLATDKV
ncbi:hypothetical protein D6_0048 [Aeromonas phage D6]|uniref:Uncharacterized protein n=1 Tax=Aeromonas phage D6 TaxID=2593322 RepID=A0A514TW03_9CAUD|nr:hypothetical protein PQC08_gp227 [Aeromonas phage D6]QDJ97208.1 hypothetical protein D6_0048 [Aeromonas phage D6]